MKNKLLLIATIICFAIMQNVSAQWQATTGPSQPNVTSLSISGSTMFAVANGTVSMTTNNGTNWTYVNSGLSGTIYAVTALGTDFFVGADGGNVYQTSNNGSNWTNTSTGLPAYAIKALAVNGGDIFAGTFGVYKSSNNGLLWSQVSSGWNVMVSSITTSGNTILAGTLGNGVYLSTDNGGSWNQINTGLPLQINSVLINGTIFLAGTNTGLYISTNNGTNWTATTVTGSINSFAAAGSNLFAGSNSGGGVYVSIDNGTTWIANNTGLTNLSVYSLATNSNYIFAGTTGYVWKRLLSDILTLTVTTSSNPSIGGTTTGGGNYAYGSSVTVSASRNNGYTFNNWKENGSIVSTDSDYTFIINANRNLVAEFSFGSSIQEVYFDNFLSIYPNPSNGSFVISADRECTIKIFNNLGQVVIYRKYYSGQTDFNINEKGIFLLVIEDINSNTVYKKQIIIQ